MKLKEIFCLLFAIVYLNALASTNDTSTRLAESILKKPVKGVSLTGLKSKSDNLQHSTIPSNLRLFNAEDGEGFVIIDAGNVSNNILAFSDKNTFSPGKAPDALKWFLMQYKSSTQDKSPQDIRLTRALANQALLDNTESEPLIKTHWAQGEPFNAHCPIVDGQQALTGCVATAMAQVINYEKKSSQIGEIPEYFTKRGVHCSSLPGRSFDFSNLSEDEIAWLMRYCGQAVEMEYGPDASGASAERIPEALSCYFGWEPEVRIMFRDNYNVQDWNKIISEEISANHPLIYSGTTKSGEGHTFVVDGYKDDYYHVNWGWGGIADGYYSFSLFGGNGDNANYTLMQSIISLRNDPPSSGVINYGTYIDGINYDLHADKTASVIPLRGGEKYKGELIIPSTVNHNGITYTVAHFGARAFTDCRELTSISIPASIIDQEWSVFAGCENLKKVNVEDMAAFIRLEVGGWWDGSPLHYGAALYLNGKIIRELVIPDGVESIGYRKFANCPSIESVVFPHSMKTIGQSAFDGCQNLKKLGMEQSSISTIDIQAFLNCVSLQEVVLPASLKTIREEAFGEVNGPGCKSLRNVICLAPTPPVAEGNEDAFSLRIYSDATLYVPSGSIDYYKRTKEWEKFEEIASASNVKRVPRIANVVVDRIEYEVNLDEKYSRILGPVEEDFNGRAKFEDAVVYEGLSYPVEEIAYEAFYGQTLYDFRLPRTIRKIGIRSFMGAKVENDFILPEAMRNIPRYSFWAFTTPKFVIGENVRQIEENGIAWHDYAEAFWEPDLEHAYIPKIECRAKIPPVIEENSFDVFLYNLSKISVPFGTKKAYLADEGWSNFKTCVNIGDEQEPTLKNDLTLTASVNGKTLLREGMSLSVAGKVFNRGEQKIDSIDLEWMIDGKKEGKKVIQQTLLPDDKCAFVLDIPIADLKSGKHDLKITCSAGSGILDDDPVDNETILQFETFDNGYYRVNLVEQFTSELCPLTPRANEKILKFIKETDNADFVARVVNHCGYLDDFLTLNRDYEWFYGDTGGTYTPAVMLNRKDFEKNGRTPVMSVTDGLEHHILNESGICNAAVSVGLELKDGKVFVNTLLTKNDDFDLSDGYDYLTVLLLEDSIPAHEQMEAFTEGPLKDYLHMKVLRKQLTYRWGQPITWNGNESMNRFATSLCPDWNLGHLSAVAFIHRYDPKDVTNCDVYTAGASTLPQYIHIPQESAKWITWNADGVERLAFELPELKTAIGRINSLNVTFSAPVDMSNYLEWKSSDESILTIENVSENMKEATVRAHSSGVAIVTVSDVDGASAIMPVYVYEDARVETLPSGPDDISVFTIDGMTISSGCNIEFLHKLPKGIYIVLAGGKRYKVLL